jgi:hypothetical protein
VPTNDARIVLRNDLRGPANRPLLRLSRRGGNFFVAGNALGYDQTVHPSGKTAPFLSNVQGVIRNKLGLGVSTPIPGATGYRDAGWEAPASEYQAIASGPRVVRTGFFANRGSSRACPHCGRKI